METKKFLTKKDMTEITAMAKDFASGMEPLFPTINGTGWLIVDPLSGFLQMEGYPHEVFKLEANETHPLVLLLVFKDEQGGELLFIPAGGDLKKQDSRFENYIWITK